MKHRLLKRIVLAILIFCNLCLIFGFSTEDAAESGETSEKVIRPVAGVVIKDFTSLPPEEQDVIVDDLQLPVRKLAHMTEFGLLALLLLLFLRTWSLPWLSCFEFGMLLQLSTASLDELYQHLSGQGRVGTPTDVLIDVAGGLCFCLVFFLILFSVQKIRKRKQKAL